VGKPEDFLAGEVGIIKSPDIIGTLPGALPDPEEY